MDHQSLKNPNFQQTYEIPKSQLISEKCGADKEGPFDDAHSENAGNSREKELRFHAGVVKFGERNGCD